MLRYDSWKKVNETAGRPAIREVSGSSLGHHAAWTNAFYEERTLALSRNKESRIKDIINKVIHL